MVKTTKPKLNWIGLNNSLWHIAREYGVDALDYDVLCTQFESTMGFPLKEDRPHLVRRAKEMLERVIELYPRIKITTYGSDGKLSTL